MPRDARELRGAWASFQSIRYADPPPDLAGLVDHYWGVEWDLRGQPPYRQKVVPYPCVHVTFRDGEALVTGPARRHVVRVLEGRGRVFGVAFRPGCFRPFADAADASAAMLVGRSVPAAEIFGAAPREDEIEEFLRARLRPDPLAGTVAAIVEHVRRDPHLTRADQLAREHGMGLRRLQRLFREYVGLGPKWVIRRYRLHEVSERLAAGAVDWAAVAADLGYADQPHLVRDFTAMVGESPTAYAQRYAPQRR
ncbi:helix-turn-helix domain-containing protein [Couchioplanes caeruleus]|uniref:helix-turn-helix domain-containing protein n=1 Tax=Couchioplanes caeruleus TaxID=56438 RepID=UPI0020BFA763|nr:helix-turn-helix domain-containing protein [Couchioplanes caeruleus]UQU66360.1 helix-turn-helix domain-containing protein [Couchioplanes caeruleus]